MVSQMTQTDNTDYMEPYAGEDMARYITEQGFKMYLEAGESLKSITNVRNIAIIVTDYKIYRVSPAYKIGFQIETLAHI